MSHQFDENLLLPFLVANTPACDLGAQWNAAQLYMLMSAANFNLQNNKNIEEKPATFSIENLLKQEQPGDERETQDSPTSCSASVSSESTQAYTLDALEHYDGRAKRSKKEADKNRCVCDQCGKSYATTSNLSRHKQTHRPLDSPHAKQCPHCDRVYVSMPALSMHILTHRAAHKCHICGKLFSRLWLLQGHIRSHTGQRPFACAHCGKSFADRSNLRSHILTHTGDKKFGCDKCGKRFALRSYLNRHIETSCRT